MTIPIYVLSTGLACPVGLSAEAACAAFRAGIARFEEIGYVDSSGHPVVGAKTDLPTDLPPVDRLVELLILAMNDWLKSAPDLDSEPVPLLVALAQPDRPGSATSEPDRIISEIKRRIPIRWDEGRSRTVPKGHTAGFEALRIARDLLTSGARGCLVCGVDSYLNSSSLAWLERTWRLKTPENSDGVIPGEAAAAVYVQATSVPKGQQSLAIRGLGFAREEAHVLSNEPLLGIGLTTATRQALTEAGLEIHETDFRLSDVTGELYGFREQVLTAARLLVVPKYYPLRHCADSIGDIGAAAGLCQAVIADNAFRKGYAPGERAVGFCSAVSGDRAVAIMEQSST